ncbi:MAG: thiosulfate reductase [Bdellovibrio sp.]|nr:MAG: thiosulfate reductase [Bdellovibrio sp.]
MMKIIEKHALVLRIVHWLNAPLLMLMIWSGIMIYWANDIYPGFFPEVVYRILGASSSLARGLAIHFFVAWFFTVNGAVYLGWIFFSGHWRELFPTVDSFRLAYPTLLHDLGLRNEAPPRGPKFNSLQRITYSGVVILGILGVLSGLAIYKPVQLNWLTSLFGGYEGARLLHFLVMICFCLFVVVHLVQVARAGWNNFRSMVAGFEVKTD